MMIGQLDWEKIDLIRLINKSGMVMGDSSVWILQVLGDVINFCSNFSSTV